MRTYSAKHFSSPRHLSTHRLILWSRFEGNKPAGRDLTSIVDGKHVPTWNAALRDGRERSNGWLGLWLLHTLSLTVGRCCEQAGTTSRSQMMAKR